MKKSLYIIQLLSILFFFSCQLKNERCRLAKKDQKNLAELFNFLFFANPGIFVLCGSKPMCSVELPPKDEMSVDQIYEMIKTMPENAHFEIVECDFNRQWELWENIQKLFPIKKFIFAKRVGPVCDNVYLINIKTAMAVLKNHHNTFREIVGFDFDPVHALYEISNPESLFWDRVLKSHLAMGLLYGFGENAKLFPSSCPPCFSSDQKIGMKEANSLYFKIPTFVTTSKENEVVKKYEDERVQIIQLFQGRDSLDLILKLLTQ